MISRSGAGGGGGVSRELAFALKRDGFALIGDAQAFGGDLTHGQGGIHAGEAAGLLGFQINDQVF